MNLAYRWFCKLGIEDAVPDHSAFSRARNERFREGAVFRRMFERVAHLKLIRKLGRLRLRSPRGARDEFVLAAIAQDLRRLASLVARPPPTQALYCVA